MLVKKMLTKSLVALAISLPVCAFALTDLHVHNKTDQFSTSKINGKGCSSDNGEVTQPNEDDHVIKGGTITAACFKAPTNCVAEIFMTKDCSGQSIATVHFNALQGKLISNTPGSNTAYTLDAAANGLSFTLAKA